MDLTSEIRKMTELQLKDDQFIVDIVASSRPGPKKISVILDGDAGISIDDCAEVSRQLSKQLDENSLIEDNYTLEVSTPGLDQPLKLKRQYKRNIGRKLRVKTVDQKLIEGKLSEVSEEIITLIEEIGNGKNKELKESSVPFSAIDKAFVLVSFK
jgi:ribosome maturation factor RimP